MKSEFGPAVRAQGDLIDLQELVRAFGRYKWGIVGLTLLAAAVSALVAFNLRPLYRGSVSLLIESQNQRVATLRDVYTSELPEVDFLGSQIAVLQSRELARRAVERLNLLDNEEFAPQPRGDFSDLRRFLPLLPENSALQTPPTEAERLDAIISAFMDRLRIEPLSAARVIKIHFDSYSPELAALVANTMADLFIESGLQARLDATTKATSWLTEKLVEIQSNLEQAEGALQAFREKEQLVNVGGTRSLTEDEVLDYSRRLREAQRRRTELQNTYEKIRQAGGDPQRLRDISNLLLDPVVQRTNESYLSAREALKQFEDRYGPKHPQMSAARARLETAEGALNEQLRIAARGVRTEYEIALESEQGLRRDLDSARNLIRGLDRKDHELSVLQRNVTTYRELYDSFLTRFKETDAAGSYQNLNARIIDPAVEPQIAVYPRKKRIVLIAAAIGLISALLLAFVHHLLNEGIGSAEELEHATQLPVLGILPLVTRFSGLKPNMLGYFVGRSATPYAEGVRSVCAALKLTLSERPIRRLLICSSAPSEGKSTVASTLALAMGGSEKVVLVDADLRRPSIARLFKIGDEQPGLAQLIAGECTLEDCLHRQGTGSTWILPAGRVPANPAELLGQERLHEILDELGTRFDRIIVDSPPVQSAADAMLLGRQCDTALFVVKSDATSRRAIRSSIKQLRFASIPLVGAVVNRVDPRRNRHYAHSYNYVYGYYGRT